MLTKTTSRIYKKTFQGENDGDTEDDTLLCRVLRDYYDEKKQPYPGWLPPDPGAPPTPQPVQAVLAPVGAGYGGGPPGQQAGLSKAGFRSLWDEQPPQQSEPQPQSFRQQRPGMAPPRLAASANPTPDVTPRELPSARGNSYQNAYKPPTAQSARDTLKDKFKPKRAVSPAVQLAEQGRQASYNSASSGNYEDSFAPRPSQGRSASSRPIVSANAPWDTRDSGFTAAGYSADYDTGRSAGGRQGLPSGPRSGRPAAGYSSNQQRYR
jgi:hypothetical protein